MFISNSKIRTKKKKMDTSSNDTNKNTKKRKATTPKTRKNSITNKKKRSEELFLRDGTPIKLLDEYQNSEYINKNKKSLYDLLSDSNNLSYFPTFELFSDFVCQLKESDCKIQEKHTSQLVVLRMTFGYPELQNYHWMGLTFLIMI